jgi:hypothetical protein
MDCALTAYGTALSDAIARTYDSGSETEVPNTDQQNNNVEVDTNCKVEGALGWILGPVCKVALEATSKAGEFVTDQLEIPSITQSNSQGSVYQAWKAFRDIANAFLVLIFLVIIFYQVLPIEIDAYTVKKVLPRLIAAAIGIQFSFFISQIGVDISNVLGRGVAGLFEALTAAAGTTTTSAIDGTSAALTAVTSGVIIWAFIGPIFFLLIAALISIITVIITIQAREIIIVFLVIASPLAMIASVLPNTEQYFKQWSSNFVKLLLMYPLIQFILSGTFLLSSILNVNGNDTVQQIMVSIIPIIGLFMIPATFKASGSLMSSIGGTISDKGFGLSKKVTGRAREDAKDLNKERGAKLMASDSRFGRATGRVMSGNTFSFGKKGRRKINALVGEVRNQQTKDADEYLKEVAPDNPALRDMLKSGRDKNGKKIDAVTRQQALSRLMANGGWPEYAELYGDAVDPTTGKFDKKRAAKNWNTSEKEAEQIWRRAHEGGNGAAAIGKGFRYTDGHKGVDNADATTLAGYRKEQIIDWMQRKIASGHTNEVMDKMGQIMSNKDLRDKLSPEVLKVMANPTTSNDLIRHADPQKQADNLARAQGLVNGLSGQSITYTDTSGVAQTMTFAAFLANHVNSTGGTRGI